MDRLTVPTSKDRTDGPDRLAKIEVQHAVHRGMVRTNGRRAEKTSEVIVSAQRGLLARARKEFPGLLRRAVDAFNSTDPDEDAQLIAAIGAIRQKLDISLAAATNLVEHLGVERFINDPYHTGKKTR